MCIKRFAFAGVFLSLCILIARLAFTQTPTTTVSSDDLVRGKRLFEGQCAPCHGMQGTGGRGPNLAQAKLRRAANLEGLTSIIKQGIEGSEMGAAWWMSDNEVAQVAAYVQSIGRVPIVPLKGNAERGREIYSTKGGCPACHIVRGIGSSLGPDLSEIGARRSADYLREALTNPGASVPEGFLMIRAVTRDGREVRGIRVNEDTFTLQIRDANNRFHSLNKLNLSDLKKEFGKTLMPGYNEILSASEIDDLVAYLAGLRVEP